MIFTGRSRELGLLRGILDGAAPRLVRVSGLPGVGKSAVVRRAATDYAGILHRCPPLPDPAQRAGLATRLGAARREAGLEGDGPASTAEWSDLFAAALECATAARRPFVLILDDAHRLTEARSRFVEPLHSIQERATTEGIRLHVVLVGREGSLPASSPSASAPAAPSSVATVHVPPLPLRAAAPHLPGSRPHERVRAYGVFGGIPHVLARLDTSVTVGTNVRRLLLDDAGSLCDAPLAWLEREVQTPSRYVALLDTLAHGEADWARLHAGVPDLTRSGQVAPYLKRLTEFGFIGMRRSLDAKPRSRATRYAIADPFIAFWFRFVFPWHHSEKTEAIGPHYARAIRPGINEHMEQMLPYICRQHMALDAIETLGAVAREGGSLWGSGSEIPVAGTLTSGAVYYGNCRWAKPEPDDTPLDQLDGAVRETRYGFGRERRLRLLFTGRPAPTWLKRDVVRRHDAKLIDAEALLGDI